jgi:hypothetical protein
MVALTVCFALIAGLPTLWPRTFSALNPLKVDTDPENMLPADEPVRVFHNKMKEEMSLHDMVVLGVVNEAHPDGVFNPDSLRKIHDLTEFAKTLRWPDEENPDQTAGVIEIDLLAPSTVDNIEQGGPGTVKFEWLMKSPPTAPEEARAIREKAERIPFLNGTLLSEDGKALCLYLPLTPRMSATRSIQSCARRSPLSPGRSSITSPACRSLKTRSAWRCSNRWRFPRRSPWSSSSC